MATIGEIAATAPASFVIGLFVGWIVSQRYRIIRNNGKDRAP